jgi:transposase
MTSRAGNTSIRHTLYMPGMVALRHNPILKTFGERLLASGHPPKAVIGSAMRKLEHLIYGLVRSGVPFRADFCSKNFIFKTVSDPRSIFQPG